MKTKKTIPFILIALFLSLSSYGELLNDLSFNNHIFLNSGVVDSGGTERASLICRYLDNNDNVFLMVMGNKKNGFKATISVNEKLIIDSIELRFNESSKTFRDNAIHEDYLVLRILELDDAESFMTNALIEANGSMFENLSLTRSFKVNCEFYGLN